MVPSQELLIERLPGWLRPHMEAIEDTRRAGFRFYFLPNRENPVMLQAIHNAHGAANFYTACSTTDAVAARFRLEDMEAGRPLPLWRAYGSVTDVVSELMQLPPHGSKGAPSLALPLSGELWVPPFTP